MFLAPMSMILPLTVVPEGDRNALIQPARR